MAVQISGNDITVPRDGTFTRNVSIGGTLTYEDVTNIDSVGLITARSGLEIGARPGVAASVSVDGNAIFSGITTVGGNLMVGDNQIPDADLHVHGNLLVEDTIGNNLRVRSTVNNGNDPNIRFQKGRGGGTPAVVQNGDDCGDLSWAGYDGGEYIVGANILGEVEGTPANGGDDMPMRLTFKTRSSGAGSAQGRLRISADGTVSLVNDSNLQIPDKIIHDGDTDTAIRFPAADTFSVETAGSERLRISSSGKITATLGSNNADGFEIQGHASQGRTTLNLIAGNATSNATTSMRLTRSNGNQPIQIFIEHDENHGNIMNGVVGGMIKFHVNESGSSLVRNVMTDTGHFINTRGTSGRIAFGTAAGVLYSGMGRYDGAAQDVGISLYATTNAGTTFVEHFRMTHNGTLQATDTSIGSLSDSRLKKNIADYSYDISKFKQFKPKTFDWINPEVHGDKTNVKGFTAQDIELIDSDWVEETFVSKDDPDFSLVSDTTTTNGAGETVGVSKASKFGYKDAMYISVIQQLISRIETLEGS